MRKNLLLLLLVAACGQDAGTLMEPTEAALNTSPPPTARTWIDGVEYEYGCPDFPCPVLAIVTEHINKGWWFWMPPGSFAKPTIYLYVLRTPVQLRTPEEPKIILPPVVLPPSAPSLSGPDELEGRLFPPQNRVICGPFQLQLNSPDGGEWSFVSGNIHYRYEQFDPITWTWVPTGTTSDVAFGATAWSEMLAGLYTLYPPDPNLEYTAVITARVQRGTTQYDVQHTIQCHMEGSDSLAGPSITGPTPVAGIRLKPANNLVCPDYQLTLHSPDGGPWSFVSGERTLQFYQFDSVKRVWVLSGQTSTTGLTQSNWNALLAGTYDIDPVVRTASYLATFTVTLARGSFEFTVSHTMTCHGHDFFLTTS